eukprot:TRINITY_DN6410_c0_g1_i1.p4 TRINITY_DN6410_c0_g1~~TRINITY_DN6410_c0_g1_i1.p4  ORF type:complete len:138 (-),score=4.63 TRINITY_DN6410_c0_g1_i1:267-680(-)
MQFVFFISLCKQLCRVVEYTECLFFFLDFRLGVSAPACQQILVQQQKLTCNMIPKVLKYKVESSFLDAILSPDYLYQLVQVQMMEFYCRQLVLLYTRQGLIFVGLQFNLSYGWRICSFVLLVLQKVMLLEHVIIVSF